MSYETKFKQPTTTEAEREEQLFLDWWQTADSLIPINCYRLNQQELDKIFGGPEGFLVPQEGSPEYVYEWAKKGFLLANLRLNIHLFRQHFNWPNGCNSVVDIRLLPEGLPLEDFRPECHQEIDLYRQWCLKVRQSFANLSSEQQVFERQKFDRWPQYLFDRVLRHERDKILNYDITSDEMFSIEAETILAGLEGDGQSFANLRQEIVNFLQIGLYNTAGKSLGRMTTIEQEAYHQICGFGLNFRLNYEYALSEGDEALRAALFGLASGNWVDKNCQEFTDVNEMLHFHTGDNSQKPYPVKSWPYDNNSWSYYGRSSSLDKIFLK